MPAFQFRFALCCFGLLFQFALVGQKVRERTRIGSQRTFSLMRGRSCHAKLLKQDLLGMDDTSSLGDTICKQAPTDVPKKFSMMLAPELLKG